MVYQIFDSFLASHRNGMFLLVLHRDRTDTIALKSMGADFLNSYTKMVDGEKDPRNLMLLFAMDRVILLEFDISQMVEVSRSMHSKLGADGLRTSSTSPSVTSPYHSDPRQTILTA